MLEAICFQSREVLEAMRKDADVAGLKLLRVDGGASRSDLLMQMQADLLQVPVKRPHFQETTALGAALAAGLGIGFWSEELVSSF
jgi:glycerol kinase